MNRLDKIKALQELINNLKKQVEVLEDEERLENPPHEHKWEDGKSVCWGYEHYGTVYSCKCGATKEVQKP
jgi:hypothetical protein